MSDTTIRIKQGTIIDPDNSFNRTTADIFIRNGIVEKISKDGISEDSTIEIDGQGCYVMPGLADLRCQLKDPGFEHQEDISTGTEAAAFSGFTALAVQPVTEPVTQNKAQIEYLKKRSLTCLPDLLPIGANH